MERARFGALMKAGLSSLVPGLSGDEGAVRLQRPR